ncbi:MAG: 6-phosphogluconolactonase [Acidobacteriota bacterium]
MRVRDREVVVCADAHEVSLRGAELFVALAHRAQASGQPLSVALSGGSTPRTLFRMLAGEDFRSRIDWRGVNLFWGDERSVPAEHPDSNYGMTQRELLDKVPILEANVHPIPTGLTTPAMAARQYEETLRSFFHLGPGEWPRFDLIYLGMGADGHTASLFPGSPALSEKERLVVENYVEKLGAWRITLTAKTLNYGRNVVFLIAGAGKASRIKEVLEGRSDPDRFPSQQIRPLNGRLLFLLDRAAASQLAGQGV